MNKAQASQLLFVYSKRIWAALQLKSGIAWEARELLHSSWLSLAEVAELVDALDSGSSDRKVVWVQVPSSAPPEKASNPVRDAKTTPPRSQA